MSIPISESVWFEQVDTAFKELIQSKVFIKNSEGVIQPVPVFIRKPDEDFKREQYPCITLYNLSAKRDNIRYFPDKLVISRNYEEGTLVEEDCAIPFKLKYQMDFWSTLQFQMNDMTRQWLGSLPNRDFNLSVIDMSGNSRDCFVLLSGDLQKSDLLDGDKRLYHSILTYDIQVEIDERMPVVVPMVGDIDVDVSRTNK